MCDCGLYRVCIISSAIKLQFKIFKQKQKKKKQKQKRKKERKTEQVSTARPLSGSFALVKACATVSLRMFVKETCINDK